MKKIFSITFLLSFLAALCYSPVYFLPMWSFTFKAPQYPQGLELQVHLTGTKGDVEEINIINHYIGMRRLDEAAPKERAMAPYVLAVLAILSLLIGLFPHRLFSFFLTLPILAFPPAFLGIFYFWLHKCGHELDPAAPVRFLPFTPKILGTGVIGQFTTYATPGIGFYLTCLPAVLVTIVLFLNNRRARPKEQMATIV